MYSSCDLILKQVEPLKLGYPPAKPEVSPEVFEKRKERLVSQMQEKRLQAVIVYADREHYSNFKYFTGVDPRFEEGLLVIHNDGKVFAALGNECFSLAKAAKIEVEGVLCQVFSLPNQPMESFVSMEEVLRHCQISNGMKIGCVDWKLFTTKLGKYRNDIFSIPNYIIDSIVAVVGDEKLLSNVTDMLIAPGYGLRMCSEADAIAEFEFGATLASQSVIDMINFAKPGMSELELADVAHSYGQVLSCHEYVVAGEHPRTGLVSPSGYVLRENDDIVISLGIEGGLTCRRGILAEGTDDGSDYIEKIVKPYMAAVFNWFEMLGVGVNCGDVFDMVQTYLPKEKYGWKLNPGHFVAYEEWMSSPFFKGSDVTVKSGMLFQMDIIPSDPDYITPNAEDGLAVADESLRQELKEKYPDVYARIMERRKFVEEQIGIKLKPEILPLSNCFAEYCPFIMSHDFAVVVK